MAGGEDSVRSTKEDCLVDCAAREGVSPGGGDKSLKSRSSKGSGDSEPASLYCERGCGARLCCWFEGGGSSFVRDVRDWGRGFVFATGLDCAGRKEFGDCMRGRASKYCELLKEGSSL